MTVNQRMIRARGLCTLTVLCFAWTCGTAAEAQSAAPTAPVIEAPPNARWWTISTVRGKSGTEAIWIDAAGVHRSSAALDGNKQTLDHAIRLNHHGVPLSVVVSGAQKEEFQVADGTARWSYGAVSQQAPWKQGFYIPGSVPDSFGSGAIQPFVLLLQALQGTRTHQLPTLPSGQATLERLTTATVARGNERRQLTAWMIGGVSFNPYVMWVDEKGDFFAHLAAPSPAEPSSWIPQGWEEASATLLAEQMRAIVAHSKQRAEALLAPPSAVVFENVTAYDAASNGFLRNVSVSVDGGKIVAVGPAGSSAIASGARRIDGRGKTLLPGLWDMHAHLWRESSGLAELSMGATSVREMSNHESIIFDQIARIEAGELIGPRVFANLALDGGTADPHSRSRYVRSLEDGLAAIRDSKQKGYHGLKIYAGLEPEWMVPFAAEAHRLGLTINGHIPQKMTILEAVRAGFDDVSHLPHFFRPGLPQSVLDMPLNDPKRWFHAVRATAHFDLDSGPMAELIEAIVRAKTAIDPTLAVYEDGIAQQPGEPSAGFRPYDGLLCAQEARATLSAAQPLPEGSGVTQREFQEGFQGFIKLTRRLHERGVKLFPGTDSNTTLLIRELELFVAAGMSIGEALETATDGAARFMGVGDKLGSIAPGMEADLILVDGDVSADIGTLRQLEWVMSRGRLIDADALRSAAGMLGRPPKRT